MNPQAPLDDRLLQLDRRVREILQSSGGWNATARARLLWFGATKRVDTGALVASVRRVCAAHELGAALPDVPERRMPDAEGASAAGRAPPARPHHVGLAAVAALGGVGLSLSVALVWWALTRTPGPEPAPSPPAPAATRPATDDLQGPGAGAGTPSPDVPPAPSAAGAGAPPVAAVYPRVPAVRADRAPAWATEALESLAGDEAELERTASQLAGGGPASDADRAAWSRASQAFAACWPLLDSRRRQSDAAALVAILPRLGDASARGALVAPLEGWRGGADTGAEALWRGAGSAGLLAALESGGADAFASAALGWLAPRAADVAGGAADAPAARAADAVVAYIGALDAAGAQPGARPARDAALVRALDALLRRGAPLDRPSVAADAAGTLLDALPWGGEPSRRAALADAFAAWCLDASVAPLPLHGLTSVLAARRPGTWWEPWLVVGARADAAERARAADRYRAALAGSAPSEPAAPTAPRITGVAQETVMRWLRAARSLDARAPSTDPAVRLAHVAERVALVEAGRLLERGRVSDAVARIAQVEDPAALAPDDQDRWKDRQERPPVRPASDDGRLQEELRARRTLADRVGVLQRLRTRAAGDLGPRDAVVLAHEAVSAAAPDARAAAANVVADAFANGPEVVRALASEMATALFAGDAARLAAMVAGVPVPRGTDDQLRAAATLMLLDHLATLEPSERHRVDSVSRELTLSAAAVVRALGAEPPGSALPEDAMAAWLAARSSEARPLVPPAALAALDARASWRRRIAQPGPQAWVAESASLVELEALLLAERLPRRRADVDAIVRRASQSRAAAVDVFAQADANARALLELARVAIDPDGGGA